MNNQIATSSAPVTTGYQIQQYAKRECRIVGSTRVAACVTHHFSQRDKMISRAGYIRRERWGGEVVMEYIPGFRSGSIFLVKDGSMYPSLGDGEHVVCSRLDGVEDLAPASLVVIRVKKQFMLKRAHIVEDHILLSCDSNSYPVQKVEMKNIQEVWQVMCKLTPAVLQNQIPIEDRVPYLEHEAARVKQQLEELVKKLSENN